MAFDAEIYSYVSRELQIPFLKMAGRFAAGLEVGDQLASFCILFIMAGYLWQKPRLVKAFTGGLFALAAGGIAVQALKHLIGRARPSKGLGDVYFIGPHFSPSGFDAFPSGHTTALFALLAFFCRYYPRWTVPMYIVGFLLALLGRVITGQHFFTDVIGGVFLGSAVGIIVAGRFRPMVESSGAPSVAQSAPEEIKTAKPGPSATGSVPLFTGIALVVVFSSAALLTASRTEPFSNLQPALYGILSALATYFLARELCGKDTALYAAMILSSSFLFVSVSRLLSSDTAWIFFTVLAFLAFVYSRKGGAMSNLLLVMAYAALGLGFLAEGPIALFPVLVFLTDEYLQEQSLIGFVARGALRHILLLAFTLAVFVFWLESGMTPMQETTAFFFDEAAAKMGLTRHAGKVIYYLPVLALAIFPWTFFAISYFVKEGRRWLRETTIVPHSRLLLLWTSIVVALFPFVAAKVPHTIVLALPPLSCLLARYIKREISPGALKFSLLATIAVAAGLLIATVIVHFRWPEYSTLKLAAPFALLTFFLVIAWMLKNRERREAMFAAICFGALAFYTSASMIAV
ncbi:MAG: phosphatase PAP2 family protein [Candidatus Binatia bacterium]